MYQFKNYALAAIGVVALALAITLVNTKRAGAQQTEAIARPPAKPASPVEVVNSPTVYLAGTPLPVFDADNARQPFQVDQVGFASINGQINASGVMAHVPDNKRLVIEQITAIGLSPNGRIVNAGLETTTGGVTAHHDLLVVDQGVSASAYLYQNVSQQVKLYADPGTNVRAYFERNDNRNSATLYFGFSGYLIDVAQFKDMGR